MKNINLNLTGRIIIIIGLLTVISILILTYDAFTVHPLLGFSTVGVILVWIGAIIVGLS